MIPRHTQRGSTLFVALIMLVVLTLLVVSAIRSASTNLRIAGNMQMQEEAAAAAQQTIEQIISSDFTSNDPAELAANIAAAVASSVAVTPDYTLAASAVCTGSVPLMNSDLVISGDPAAVTEDAPCFSSSTASNTGLISHTGEPVTTGQSWCFAQQWNIEASAVSATGFGANVTTDQGVALRVPAGTLCN